MFRVFAIDVIFFPDCSACMRIIRTITDSKVIGPFLMRIGLPTDPTTH